MKNLLTRSHMSLPLSITSWTLRPRSQLLYIYNYSCTLFLLVPKEKRVTSRKFHASRKQIFSTDYSDDWTCQHSDSFTCFYPPVFWIHLSLSLAWISMDGRQKCMVRDETISRLLGISWWSSGWDSMFQTLGGLDSNSGQGTRSHTPQLKILPAATKIMCWHSQINK